MIFFFKKKEMVLRCLLYEDTKIQTRKIVSEHQENKCFDKSLTTQKSKSDRKRRNCSTKKFDVSLSHFYFRK